MGSRGKSSNRVNISETYWFSTTPDSWSQSLLGRMDWLPISFNLQLQETVTRWQLQPCFHIQVNLVSKWIKQDRLERWSVILIFTELIHLFIYLVGPSAEIRAGTDRRLSALLFRNVYRCVFRWDSVQLTRLSPVLGSIPTHSGKVRATHLWY